MADPGTTLAELLARLTSSPRVQYIGKSITGAIPQIGGPLLTKQSNQHAAPQAPLGAGIANAMGSSLAGAIGSFANSLNQPQQPQDPLMALYAQMLNRLQQPVQMPNAPDPKALMAQVQAAINPIYDQREQQAKQTTGKATGDINSLYKGLSQDYEKLAPQQVAQANDAQNQIKDLYGQLKNNLEGSYSRVSKEQGDLFKSLGIESALPEVLGDQAPAVQQASAAADENQAQQQQRYMDMGQIDSTYYREGAPNALLAGNEVSGDMLAKLQQYVQQTEAERSSGIQSAYADQLGQANSLYSQQQSAANSDANNRQQMLWQILQQQMQGQQQQALTPDSFMGSLPANTQQSVAGAFTQLERSPEAVYGKVQDPRSPVPGTFVSTTPEWYLSKADEMYQQGKIDATTHQALLMYIQLALKSGQ